MASKENNNVFANQNFSKFYNIDLNIIPKNFRKNLPNKNSNKEQYVNKNI